MATKAPEGTPPHTLTHMGIMDAQVCSSGTNDEALAWLREHYAAGTSGNWQKNNEGTYAPVACDGLEGFTHYMFVC